MWCWGIQRLDFDFRGSFSRSEQALTLGDLEQIVEWVKNGMKPERIVSYGKHL